HPALAARLGLLRARPGDRPRARARRGRDPARDVAARAAARRRPRALGPRAGRGGDLVIEEIRARFPVLERFAYLNAGTFGPLARETIAAVEERQRADLERGRAGREYFEQMVALRDRARAALARELGVDAAHVALTTSTTDAVNTALAGLDLAA